MCGQHRPSSLLSTCPRSLQPLYFLEQLRNLFLRCPGPFLGRALLLRGFLCGQAFSLPFLLRCPCPFLGSFALLAFLLPFLLGSFTLLLRPFRGFLRGLALFAFSLPLFLLLFGTS
ncbi:hypothetical protein M404DRAFT_319088 [Pisolithus tinctorius Marx 270]|uniref:Transmembrane protein n=1 Tax=Pisolithus tinctorius Marx 270 TaxID=870435 RepID=A0A0C3JCB0_PISTI|nr:hypothetical protein M404DRAFT_319088 [Pisolithus tinctorius Marx 270]